jgi:hypothetical protein
LRPGRRLSHASDRCPRYLPSRSSRVRTRRPSAAASISRIISRCMVYANTYSYTSGYM